ncbi:putative virion structural protein [Ralstonia phage RP31]|uniref:Putative virion structural protein n=2 Tax=Ripduovirus RP12 TaxID=2560700 RepID=A0A1L7N158_9CAUD|nr:putative virion structural protein [Ralstonia phage RP12]BAW19219.1 putative virion structural protein [Ralstonia phage RP12]BAW19505.1 putative virion structural protein [Ralstonia phage RP31]
MSNMFTDVWGRTFTQGGTVNGVEDVWARSAIGNPGVAVTETLYGLNHRSLANSIPINKDYYGLAFFTRPDLRFTNDNLLKLRKFVPMLTTREASLPRAIRAMLDFRHNTHNEESYNCSLIDPKQAFIPLLTNQLVSMSGWPDLELPTYTSEAGVYGEMFSFADGISEVYRTWDMTANFRNIPGDPITSMFYYWLMYAQAVFEGTLTPYADNVAENTIDYQTRIYRVVLDSTKRFVQKIACTGASFPTSVPMGMSFNFETDTPINRLDQIPISFRCIGAEYLDDMIIHDFNAAVCFANNDMFDDQRQGAGLVKVPYEYIFLFNHLGYPRINANTFELEWWVYNNTFQELTGGSSNTSDTVNFNPDAVDAGDLNTYTGNIPINGVKR